MAMVMATWAAAAEVIITDGDGDAVTTTAGHAVDITTAIEPEQEAVFCGLRFTWPSLRGSLRLDRA
jgi:hypothetical protein